MYVQNGFFTALKISSAFDLSCRARSPAVAVRYTFVFLMMLHVCMYVWMYVCMYRMAFLQLFRLLTCKCVDMFSRMAFLQLFRLLTCKCVDMFGYVYETLPKHLTSLLFWEKQKTKWRETDYELWNIYTVLTFSPPSRTEVPKSVRHRLESRKTSTDRAWIRCTFMTHVSDVDMHAHVSLS